MEIKLTIQATTHQVAAMQQQLRQKGIDPGPVDGIYGKRTEQGLLQFIRLLMEPEQQTAQAQAHRWQPPAAAAPYLAIIRDCERDYGLPSNLLARLIHQESRYRPDIISGETISTAGAVGICQIVPKWHPECRDPKNPQEAIPYAARFLEKLQRSYGKWDIALAAYNWGPGNVSKWLTMRKGYEALPEETRRYVREICADVEGVEDTITGARST